ncbi:MAG: hypothetical protein V4519_03925 [Patescibacteria group bacterium]
MWEIAATKLAGVFIGVGMDKTGNWLKKVLTKKKIPSIEEIKRSTKVLFVDDEDFSTRLNIIRGAGWNVQQIKDVTNFDSEDIKNADIIFMDYIGVGKILTPSEEGIGLLKKIKSRYPEKFLIFYSGHAGYIPGHEFHSFANAWIDKHSDPYVYIDQIEVAAIKKYESK